MNKTRAYLALLLLAFMLAGCAATSEVDTEDGVCFLKATHGDVYLKVFDVDSNGNMGALVWQGRINRGQTARIRTTHAFFRYFYNSEPDVAQPFTSGIDKDCDDLDTVEVP
ncbi:MAG: hypothetical protein PVI38_08120 [Desulfobacterales bacterium]|jgi:hypothetical protein